MAVVAFYYNSRSQEKPITIENQALNPHSVIPIDIRISAEDFQHMMDTAEDKPYHKVHLKINNENVGEVGIRTKGSYTLLDLINYFKSNRFSFMLNLNYYKKKLNYNGFTKLNLNCNLYDLYSMKETLAYTIFREMGVPAPETCYAYITINGVDWGLYTLVEDVNTTFIKKNFGDSNGTLYKPHIGIGTLEWRGEEFSRNSDYSIQFGSDPNNEKIIKMLKILNTGGDLESVLDVDEILRYFACEVAIANYDGYSLGHNFYLYEQNGVFSIIPWDYNQAFGTVTYDGLSIYQLATGISETKERPLLYKLLEVEEYKARYEEYLRQITETYLVPEKLEPRVKEIAEIIDAYMAKDPTKFYYYEDWKKFTLSTKKSGDVGLIGLMSVYSEQILEQLDGKRTVFEIADEPIPEYELDFKQMGYTDGVIPLIIQADKKETMFTMKVVGVIFVGGTFLALIWKRRRKTPVY